MRTRTLFLLIFLAIPAMAQSVVITDRKVTYKRSKPISEYKKTFTINYPTVKASTPALSKKIEAAISYSSVLGLNLKEELNEIQWLEEAEYEVGYNKNGILSITLMMDGSGAYPSGTSKIVVVDLKTGLRVKPSDVFTNTTGLLAKVKKAKDAEVAKAISDLKKDPENAELYPEAFFNESNQYHKVSLDEFSVSDLGVTFHHDYGFAHAVQALQPDGTFFFFWDQVKPYIKRGGLLSKMVR